MLTQAHPYINTLRRPTVGGLCAIMPTGASEAAHPRVYASYTAGLLLHLISGYPTPYFIISTAAQRNRFSGSNWYQFVLKLETAAQQWPLNPGFLEAGFTSEASASWKPGFLEARFPGNQELIFGRSSGRLVFDGATSQPPPRCPSSPRPFLFRPTHHTLRRTPQHGILLIPSLNICF